MMTISIFRLINRVLLLCVPFFASNVLADNAIKSVILVMADGKELERYNLHEGLNPEKVNVEVEFRNVTPGNAVILEVIPVVGFTNWIKNEGITDIALLDKSSQPLGSVYRDSRLVEVGESKAEFKAFGLSEVIQYYSSKLLWPRQLVFRASLAPSNKEQNLSDNVSEFSLRLDPPD